MQSSSLSTSLSATVVSRGSFCVVVVEERRWAALSRCKALRAVSKMRFDSVEKCLAVHR